MYEYTEYIRILNSFVLAATSMAMFVYFNEAWSVDSKALKMIRFGSVAVYAAVAEGSIEAFYRHAPMAVGTYLILSTTLIVDAGLIIAFRARQSVAKQEKADR